jgi:uncharacterized protein YjbJ (UPF0337 family)
MGWRLSMKLTPWIIAAVSVGVLAHILQRTKLRNDLSGTTAKDKLSDWGAKQSFGGRLQYAGGSLKRGVADLSGDGRLEVDGILDQLAGGISVSAGKAAQIIQHEIEDLER